MQKSCNVTSTFRLVSKGNRTVSFLRRNLRDCTSPVKDSTYIKWYALFRSTHHLSGTLTSKPTSKPRNMSNDVRLHTSSTDFSTRIPGCGTRMLDDLEWEPLEVRRRYDRMQHDLVDIHANRYLSPCDSHTRRTIFRRE